MLRSEAADFYTAGFNQAIGEFYDERPLLMSKVFNEINLKKGKEWKHTSISGTAAWSEYDEYNGAPADDPIQMYDKTFTPTKRGARFPMSFEAMDDDLYGEMDAMSDPENFIVGSHTNVETDAFNHFNNAFDTGGSYNGADGVSLCNDQHPRNPNEATTYGDNYTTDAFDHDGLEAMEVHIATYLKGPRGEQIAIPRSGMIAASPTLNGPIQRVINDRAQYRPDEMTMALNIYSKGQSGSMLNYTPVISEYITGTAYWFVVFKTIGPVKGLVWIWRLKPRFANWVDEENETVWFRGQMRADSGWTGPGWRCVWGSDGTA